MNKDNDVKLEDLVYYKPYSVYDDYQKQNNKREDIFIDYSGCGCDSDIYENKFEIIELKSGKITSPITINKSNVWIKGNGANIDSQLDKLIVVEGNGRLTKTTSYNLSDSYYPVGCREFTIGNHSIKVGDDIVITQTPNKLWLETLRETSKWELKPWKETWELKAYRKVESVNGNKIVVDTPTTFSIDSRFGVGQLSLYKNIRIKNIIISDIIIKTTNPSSVACAIYLDNCENVLIRDITIYGYDRGVKSYVGGKRIHVHNVKVLDPVSDPVGGNRYAFDNDSQQILFTNCETTHSRHPYAGGGRACGPCAFVYSDARTNMGDATSQPHRMWGNGFLYDCIMESNGINFEHRRDSGSGHGWATANCTMWNCFCAVERDGITHSDGEASEKRKGIVCENVPTSRNFSIGCIGNIGSFYKSFDTSPKLDLHRSIGTYISQNTRVSPYSLFLWQKSKSKTPLFPQGIVINTFNDPPYSTYFGTSSSPTGGATAGPTGGATAGPTGGATTGGATGGATGESLINWKTGISYKINDVVIYNNNVYTCLNPHKSIQTWNPQDAVSLWKLILHGCDCK